MKFLSTTLALAALLPLTLARSKGFNVAANSADGACKNEGDWEKSFKEMKKIPGDFHEVRVYASSDCNTLERAVPAAKKTGVKILAGVWAEPDTHFQAEKAALMKAVHEHGVGWLSAISVGSEDLYRGDLSPGHLVNEIHDIRRSMATVQGGHAIPIGHVDTWTEWVKGANAGVIKAVDFVGLDGYPYYQGSTIANSKKVFYKSLKVTREAVAKHKKGTPIIITETGWPVSGPNDKSAVPSVQNAAHYWHNTMCGLFKEHSVYYYSLRDYNVAPDPGFGVLDSNWKPVFDLKCI